MATAMRAGQSTKIPSYGCPTAWREGTPLPPLWYHAAARQAAQNAHQELTCETLVKKEGGLLSVAVLSSLAQYTARYQYQGGGVWHVSMWIDGLIITVITGQPYFTGCAVQRFIGGYLLCTESKFMYD